ncbi:TMAO reductase system periplasmic protein TorT [Pseudomonas sp. 8Z]|uniref:TMAO reductase system periplasmic protein TorT n=1 Tax=Pseudomonas sp. 8Z TaxID=2653166 RepID=UPI0012F22585|nr:TMAO reductase system periplasmic protein TorT [Pseudomonas sp. 8Z]VXC09885.1 TMAO reductase system periplasmic protein TorT [Pseudomonas sp. 8Z]
MRWLSLLCFFAYQSLQAAEWFPYPVEVDGRMQDYRPVKQAAAPWRICALLPHGKDRYWWGVAWGLSQESKRLGLRLGIYEAGGYEHAVVQREQFEQCVAQGAEAFVLAGINTYDLCPIVEQQIKAGRPVIDLVNRLECPGVSAHSRVDFANMARATLEYVVQRSVGRAVRVGWLPGPADAGWVQDAERGLRDALAGTSVTLAHGGYGPVDRSRQAQLVRELFKQQPQLDYLIGNAEAAAFAAQLVKNTGAKTQVLSFYATERVLEQIREGQVLAAPTDSPVIQARIALDLAVRGLQGETLPKLVSPKIEMLDAATLGHFDLGRLMPPDGHWMIRQDLPN